MKGNQGKLRCRTVARLPEGEDFGQIETVDAESGSPLYEYWLAQGSTLGAIHLRNPDDYKDTIPHIISKRKWRGTSATTGKY